MKIAIIYGRVNSAAAADEKDVLVEVETVRAALTCLGYDPLLMTATLDLSALDQALRKASPQLVFNLVESIEGNGRFIHLVPALLENLNLLYTGASQEAIFLSSNKVLAKRIMQLAGIPTPGWCTISRDPELAIKIPLPVILKSVWEHASIGLEACSVFKQQDICREYLRQLPAGSRKTDFFLEGFIEGREFNLALLQTSAGIRILPPAEIIFDNFSPDMPRIVGYKAKWDENSFEFHNTHRKFTFPETDNNLISRLKTLARQCWDVFQLRGYCRVDFRVDQEGCPYVLEINTNPCISPDSGFMAAAQQAGLAINQVVDHIIGSTLRDLPGEKL